MKRLQSVMIWTGGVALLAAAAVDTIAVVGRQVGFAVHGAIELIQAAVLVAGSFALIASTVAKTHPRVRILVERVQHLRSWAERTGDVLMVLFLAALLGGSAWLSFDLWNSHEVSESAGVPWRWLRLVVNVALVAMIAVVGRHWIRERSQ